MFFLRLPDRLDRGLAAHGLVKGRGAPILCCPTVSLPPEGIHPRCAATIMKAALEVGRRARCGVGIPYVAARTVPCMRWRSKRQGALGRCAQTVSTGVHDISRTCRGCGPSKAATLATLRRRPVLEAGLGDSGRVRASAREVGIRGTRTSWPFFLHAAGMSGTPAFREAGGRGLTRRNPPTFIPAGTPIRAMDPLRSDPRFYVRGAIVYSRNSGWG